MTILAVTLYLLLTNALAESLNGTDEFVDIRSVYYYSPEAANNEGAVTICRMYSAWLISFDHAKELTDVTTFFRDIPFPPRGEDIEIQTSAVRRSNSSRDRFHFEWHYPFKKPKLQGALHWCHMDNTLTYPIDLPNFMCLKIALKRNSKTWCYKNYDCKNYLPFICERKLAWIQLPQVDPLAKIDDPALDPPTTVDPIPLGMRQQGENYPYETIENITCEDDRYVRIASTYYVKENPWKRQECDYSRTHLVYLETHDEAQALAKYLSNCTTEGTYWTGGEKNGGSYRWPGLDYITFTDEHKFCEGEPRDDEEYDYVVLVVKHGEYCLKMELSSERHKHICEREEEMIIIEDF